MVTDGNSTYCGDHFVVQISSYYVETIMLYPNLTSTSKESDGSSLKNTHFWQ